MFSTHNPTPPRIAVTPPVYEVEIVATLTLLVLDTAYRVIVGQIRLNFNNPDSTTPYSFLESTPIPTELKYGFKSVDPDDP